jgi:hypothetical protein
LISNWNLTMVSIEFLELEPQGALRVRTCPYVRGDHVAATWWSAARSRTGPTWPGSTTSSLTPVPLTNQSAWKSTGLLSN